MHPDGPLNPGPAPRRRHWLWLTLLLGLAASINALLFSSRAATPLVESDAWYFVEWFIAKYLDGSLGLLDLFMQRGGGDHAQPLQKLILLWHTAFFDMDFRFEGLAGTVAGILFCLLLSWPLRRLAADHSSAALQAALIGLIFLIGLSLNATNIYAWPLVTLGFVLLALATGIALLILGTRLGESHTATLLLAFLLGLLADEQGVIFTVALVIGLLLFHDRPWRRLLGSSAAMLAGLLLSRLLLAWIARRNGVSADAFESHPSLLPLLGSSEAFQALLIPLGDSLLHREHWLRPDSITSNLRWPSIALAAALHGWSWISLLRLRLAGHKAPQLALAVFLLLTSYAVLLGIVVNRVSVFGWDYLHQPRYVFFYQLPLLAALLLLHYRLGLPRSGRSGVLRGATLVLIVLLTGLQYQLSLHAWELPSHLVHYWRGAAAAMEKMRLDPQTRPEPCHSILAPCDYDPQHRAKVIGLLFEARLNLYSPAFQRRHDLILREADETGNGSGSPFSSRRRSDNGMLTVDKARIDLCSEPEGIVSSLIRWDASASGTQTTQIWLQLPGQSAVLWSQAGAAGQASTGRWLRDGSQVILIDPENDQQLARIKIRALPCPY